MSKIQMIFCFLLLGGYAIRNIYCEELFSNDDFRILPGGSRPQWSQFLFLGSQNTQNPHSNGYFYQIDPHKQTHHKILPPNERLRVPLLINQMTNFRLYEQRNNKEIQESLHGRGMQAFPPRRDFQANNQQRPPLNQNNGYFSGAPQGVGSANLERNVYQIPNRRILSSASGPIKTELKEQTYFPHQNFEHIKMNTESARLHRDPLRENQNQRINAHRIPIQINAESNGQTGVSHQNVEHVKVNAETAQLSTSLQRENQNERINIKSQKVSAIVPRKQFCNLAPCLNDSAEFASEGNTNGIKNGSPIAFLNNSRPQFDNKLHRKNMNQSPLIRNITHQSTPESIIKPQNSQQSFIRSNVKPSHILGVNLKTQENRTKLDDVQSPASITTHKSKIKKLPSTSQIRGSQRYWRKVTRVQSIPPAQNKHLIQDFIMTTTERSITSVQQLPPQANTTEISKLDYTDEDVLFSDSFSTPLFGQRLRHVKTLSQQNKKTNIQNHSSIAIDSSKTENLQTSQMNHKTLNNIKRKQYENSLAELNKTIFSLFWNSERLPIKNESQSSMYEEDLLQENVPEISNIKSITHGIDNGSLKLVSYPDYILGSTTFHTTGEKIYTTEDIPNRKLKPNSFTTIRKIGMTAEQDGGKQKPKQPFQSIRSHQSVLEREISPLVSPQLHPPNISSYKPTSTPAHHRATDPYISQTEDFYKQERPNNDMKNMKNRNSNKQKLNAGFQSFRSPVEIERETNPLDSPQQHDTESYELTATTELQKPTEPNIFQTDYIKGLKNAVLKLKVQVLPISKNETSEKNDAEIKPDSIHHLHVFTNVYSKLPPNQIQSYFAPVKQYYIPPSHYHYPKFSYAPDPVSNPQNQFSFITPSFQEWQRQERNKTVKPTIRDQEPIIDNSDPHFSAKSAFSRNTEEVTPATETTTPPPHKSKAVKSANKKLEKIREKEETETSTTVISSGSHNQVFHFGLNGSFKPVINVISAKTSELPREVYDKQKNIKIDNHRGMQFSPAPEVSTNSKNKCDTQSFSGSSVNCNSNLKNENVRLEITSTESKHKDRLTATESPAVSNQSGRLKSFIPTRKVPFRLLTNRENQKSSLETESSTTLQQQNFYRNNTTDRKAHVIWSKNRGSKNDSSSVGGIPIVSKKQNDFYRSLNGNRGISILQSLKLENSSMMKSTAYLARNNNTSNLYNMKTPYPDGKSLLPQIKDTQVNNRTTEKANISNFSLHSSDNNSSRDSVIQPLTKTSQVKITYEPPTITDIKNNNDKLIYPTKDEFPIVKQGGIFLLNLSQVSNFNQNVSGDLTKLTQSSDDVILSDSKRKEVKLHANETKETFKAIVPLEIDENNATTAELRITTVTTDNYNEIRETTTFKSQTDLENKVIISTTNETDSMISTTENPKSKDVLSTNVIESTLKETSNKLLEYVSATSILDDVSTEKPTTGELSSNHSTEFGTIIQNIPFFEESGKMMKIEKQKPEAKHSVPSEKGLSQNNTENSVKTDEESNQNTTQSMNILNEFQNAILLQQPLNISIHSQSNNSISEEIFRTKEDLKINEKNKPKTSNEKDFNSNEGIVLTERTTPMQKIRTADFTEINDKNATFSDITHNKTVESLNERSSENNTNLDASSFVDEMGIDIKTPVNRISNFTEQRNSIVMVTNEPPTTELNTIGIGTAISILENESQLITSHD
ncbi:hypothetical protein AVEN_165344-1 [Araneus ventricosus]|uniref:Uncharacterized protein n=1 Tax=Araneus ventricosus TaxID=182803 RepID=A0A4Y2AUD2_ARAVE|nr:hypothetical protein AVEN_165344-1 [Araneus ventricosus]